MSVDQQTRRRLNMQPCSLNIYAAQSHTENARTCRVECAIGWLATRRRMLERRLHEGCRR
jgi:hypothetical protein